APASRARTARAENGSRLRVIVTPPFAPRARPGYTEPARPPRPPDGEMETGNAHGREHRIEPVVAHRGCDPGRCLLAPYATTRPGAGHRGTRGGAVPAPRRAGALCVHRRRA